MQSYIETPRLHPPGGEYSYPPTGGGTVIVGMVVLVFREALVGAGPIAIAVQVTSALHP